MTNPTNNIDKAFVKKAKLASPRHVYSDTWREACRNLLLKYIEIRNEQEVTTFRAADLHRTIMDPHHQRDRLNRVVNRDTSVSRQDIANFLSGRSGLSSPKFRYVDFFVNTSAVWSNELFKSARKEVIRTQKISDARKLAELFSPPAALYDSDGFADVPQKSFYILTQVSEAIRYVRSADKNVVENALNAVVPVFVALEHYGGNCHLLNVFMLQCSEFLIAVKASDDYVLGQHPEPNFLEPSLYNGLLSGYAIPTVLNQHNELESTYEYTAFLFSRLIGHADERAVGSQPSYLFPYLSYSSLALEKSHPIRETSVEPAQTARSIDFSLDFHRFNSQMMPLNLAEARYNRFTFRRFIPQSNFSRSFLLPKSFALELKNYSNNFEESEILC